MSNFMSVDANRMQSNSNQSSVQSAPNNQVEQNDVDDFEQAMSKENDENKNFSNNSFAQMTNPLDSLLSMRANNTLATQTPQNTMPLNSEKLCETILVSQPDADSQEVRLTLNKDILPDTEIKIMRDANGMLNISLSSSNSSSFQTLVQGQHDLRQLLEKSGEQANIQVNSGDASQDGRDEERRSSTYMGYEETV